MKTNPSALTKALRTGWKAARQNQIPGLVMWILGIGIIGGYYYSATIHDVLESVGQFKSYWGWKFSLISTAIFGGLIPALVSMGLPSQPSDVAPDDDRPSNRTWEYVIASTLLWAYKGIEIDSFYHFQAWLFGTNADVATVLTKTFCDQFVMVPIIGMVNVVLFYHWRDCGYSFSRAWQRLGSGWYSRKVLPVLIANWFIWIPAVAMIYCLPTALQLPVQNLILCFWVLILLVFTGDEDSDADPVEQELD